MPTPPLRRNAALLVVAVLAAAALAWSILRPARWDDPSTPPPAFERARHRFDSGATDAAARELRRALRRTRATQWELRYRVLAATRLVDAGQLEEAGRFLSVPLRDGDPLAAHAEFLRARIFLAQEKPAEAEAAANRAAERPGFPGRDEAVRLAAGAMDSQGRTAEAIRRLDASPSWPLRLEASRLALQSGDLAGARERLVRLVFHSDDPLTAERALEILEDTVTDPSRRFTPDERRDVLETAARFTEEGRPGPALRLVRAARTSNGPNVPPAEALEEAHALWRMGRESEARVPALRARSGTGLARDGGTYVLARLDLSRGRVSAWRAALESLARRQGSSPWKLRALRDLAMSGEGSPSAATLARYRAYRLAAGTRADPTALVREFWAAWDIRRFDEADAALARILARDDMPSGVRAAALYWTGRRLESKGLATEAKRGVFAELRARFPNHYYVALLERSLGERPPVAPVDDPPPAGPEACGPGAVWIEAARQLAAVGLWPEAADSYRAAVSLAPPECKRATAIEAMAAARSAESTTDVLEFAAAAVGDRETCPADAVPVSVWRALLPAPAGDLVERAARAKGLDGRFLAAVIRQESAFQPMAVSAAGARGLLQIMPSVGSEWARRLGVREFRAERLFEPELNLQLGTAYLRALLDRFPFPAAALAAYNAGPARAERWLHPRDREDAYAERIPIPETRLYVKGILTLERLYRIAWPEGLDEASSRRE